MKRTPGRNERCLCGSGKKFKNCCEAKLTATGGRTQLWLALVLGGIVVLGVAGLVASFWQGGQLTPNRVWSPEHGHWHVVGGRSRDLPSQPVPQPPGPAPLGKVWSPEHGHWHDAR